MKKNTNQPVIRDKEFAKRLEIACENNPHCPTEQYRGKQKWVYDSLEEQFGIKVSPEAVRRWFAGEMRPRPKTIAALARLLDVDTAWLTLGTKPDMQPKEQKARNAVADAAVNLVAGIIQMQGGHVAFPEANEADVDMFAIINGRQHAIEVRLEFKMDSMKRRFMVRRDSGKNLVIGVVPLEIETGFGFQLLLLDPKQGDSRGDFSEIIVERHGKTFLSSKERVPEIVDFRQLADQSRAQCQGPCAA